MKNIRLYSLLCTLLLLTSCEIFKIDNYEEPSETLQGEVVDAATGEPILTDQGSEGIRVRLTELSSIVCQTVLSRIQKSSKVNIMYALMARSSHW